MAADIEGYVRSARPVNVLDLIDRLVLENFLAGYGHLAFSGTAVFCKVCDGFPERDEDIVRISSGGEESVLVQRESDKSTSQLRDCLAFGKEVFLGITKL